MLLWATTLKSRLDAAENILKPHLCNQRVCFSGFVNWDFHHRRNLKSWKTTAIVIQRTLHLWYPQHMEGSIVENGSPEVFQQFLQSLPVEKDCGISLVYLASHQSPSREWDFTQKKVVLLDNLLERAKVPPHAGRIVILDACYSEAVAHQPLWRQKLGPISLFASIASEETPEANFHSPQPVDFAHRYPAAYVWLKDCLGRNWDGKISFLGFVWLQTFLSEKSAPASLSEWVNFLQRCQSTAAEFRRKVSRSSSSEVTLAAEGSWHIQPKSPMRSH